MTYALVHLLGDDATTEAGRLVEHLQTQRAPLRTWASEAPPHHEVASTLADGRPQGSAPTAVCIGHGSPRGVGPTPNRVWADANDLGTIFRDGRLYAYACNTAGSIDSLAARTVRAGVRIFVGHGTTIRAPLAPEQQEMVESVAGAAIIAFIDGQDDEQALIRAIDDAALEIIPDGTPLDFAACRDVPNNWTQRRLFDALASSLYVHRRSSLVKDESPSE
ncbi:hypothetical protein [Paraliomyxa miuraensis]|uniref:hypothetical protein n=1 Tax=Paraliomyxa miuraensis TaxID=376150 RepID=UPI0022535697|nr:hypothetical protein [Paraliomyxa miuraensis]MCX4243846.1 hypothetical protein [Paraliomyxa miuraensis]